MERRTRCLDLKDKTDEELAALVEELSTYCMEQQKMCEKLQREIEDIQSGINNSMAKRAAMMPKYAEKAELQPLVEKDEETKKTLVELEEKLKQSVVEAEGPKRRQGLREEIGRLQSEKNRLSSNHDALLQNIANVKCQIAEVENQSKCKRLTRREADDLLDDLVRQNLPERFFKSRKKSEEDL